MKRRNPEDQLQIAVIHYLRHALPEGVTVFHPANGGSRDEREGAKLQAMGVLAGVPDLIFVREHDWFAIELKAGQGRLTETQKAFADDYPARVAVCRSINDVQAALTAWGVRLTARAA